jgi:tetratricopeptide (TPR) repeat protein
MWRNSLAIFLTLALTLSDAPRCFAKDLIKSLAVETQVYQQTLQAEGLLAASQYAAARELLVKAAQYDPSSYSRSVHRDLSRCYKGLKQYDKAVAEAKKVLAIDPSCAAAWFDIGSAYYEAQRYDLSVDAMNKYLALSSDESDRKLAQQWIKQAGSYGFMRKGREALENDHYAEAKKWLQKATAYDPSPYSSLIHANLCYVLQQLGESGAAIEEGKRALAIEPNDTQTNYSIGMAYADMLRFDDAIIWMNKYASMEADPARRKQAMNTVAAIQDDKKQYNNPNNKKPDYLEVMRADGDQVRWPKQNIPLKVAIMPGSNVKGYKPAFANLVKVALDNWCQASGNRIDYKLTNDPNDADIRVVWTKDPLEVTLDHPNVQATGLTNVENDGNGVATSAIVQVRTVDPFHPDQNVEDNECAHVVLHEIGHALGVGHSKFIRDVMYFRSAPQQQALTPRDRATIARLYDGYPVVGFVPKHTSNPSGPTVPVAPAAFLPPEAPDDSKVVPPMFLPPPVDDEKLTPPMFTPPPAADVEEKVQVPMFTPPPLHSGSTVPKKTTVQAKKSASSPSKPEKVVVPFFTPPPAK